MTAALPVVPAGLCDKAVIRRPGSRHRASTTLASSGADRHHDSCGAAHLWTTHSFPSGKIVVSVGRKASTAIAIASRFHV